MAKSRWINIQFVGNPPDLYKGFQIHLVEIHYSDSGVTRDEYAVFKDINNSMQVFGHCDTNAAARQFIDVIAAHYP